MDIKKAGPETVRTICRERGLDLNVDQLFKVLEEKTSLQQEVEGLRSKSNSIAGDIKKASPDDRKGLIEKGTKLKGELKTLEEKYTELSSTLKEMSMAVPNDYPEDTPLGHDEDSNVELEVFGRKPEYSFKPKDHIELAKIHGLDLEAGARVAGAGFPLMKGATAMLETAVLRYTIDKAIEKGFTPVSVPLLARTDILKGIGFNPRRSDEGSEIFCTAHDDLCLAGTAEIPLVGHYADEILKTDSLPVKMVAMTACFRREGASGRRDAGLYRNKMFNKCELVVLTTPEKSQETLEEIRAFETEIFQGMGIHFRVVRICAGDLGAPAYMKYDLEGWMLGRGKDEESAGWGELTSCSNCTDFQAKRLLIRHRSGKNKPAPVHTLNGTGITTRALIPILEQFQNEDGTVRIPEVLRPYMGGKEVI